MKGKLPRSSRKDPVDLAIVGGGVAGLYLAWRVARSRPRHRIALLEKSARLGGRLLSTRLPGMSTTVELGAMRYADNHVLLRALIEDSPARPALGRPERPAPLPLAHRKFPLLDTVYHLRGAPYSTTPPYRLAVREPGLPEAFPADPSKLILIAFLETLQKLKLPHRELRSKLRRIQPKRGVPPRLTLAEWELVKRDGVFDKIPLCNIGLWSLLHKHLGAEGFALVHDGLGYESIISNWNAAEAIHWYMRDFQPQYRTMANGMQSLTNELERSLRQELTNSGRPQHIALEQELATLTWERGCFTLGLIDPSVPDDDRFDRSVTDQGPVKRHLYAKRVVLALPRRALQGIRLIGFDDDERHRFEISKRSVRENTMFKLLLGYRRAWWERTGLKVVTDLPIRQLYCWPHDGGEGAVMASYSDAHYVDFWRPLHRRDPFRKEIYPPFRRSAHRLLDPVDAAILEHYGASDRMVAKALAQINTILGDTPGRRRAIDNPEVALEREWRSAWHTWVVGVHPWKLIDYMVKPFPAREIFVCGEAYSGEQGWVEGALRSAEQVLAKLGIDQEEWISAMDLTPTGCDTCAEYLSGVVLENDES